MPTAKSPRQSGKVSLTEEECYCDIPKLYDIIATKLGHNTTDIRYDCRKICVSKPVMEQVFAFYETERKMSRMLFNQLWLIIGPKANLTGDDYKADIQRGFISEGEV